MMQLCAGPLQDIEVYPALRDAAAGQREYRKVSVQMDQSSLAKKLALRMPECLNLPAE